MTEPSAAPAVVSDATPLIAFASIGRLLLLRRLFATIAVPPAVHGEVVFRASYRPGAAEVLSASWITVVGPRGTARVDGLIREASLDPGEAEAIVLAGEMRARLLLIDERRGRREAAREGLRRTGSGGVLVMAKERGFIPNVSEPLRAMIAAGFYLSNSAHHQILEEAGEEP